MHGFFPPHRPEKPDREAEDGDHDDARQKRSMGIASLVIIAALIGVGYFLTIKLREMGRIQDCVMSGRTNCAPIEVK